MKTEGQGNTIEVQPSFGNEEEDPLMPNQDNETADQEYVRQRGMAKEACDLGRKYLQEPNYQLASKQFSKAVMTFEFILKNNPRMKDFKGEITSMLKEIILPAYSNLSLCYWKMERWGLVVTMANQVIESYPDNTKNLFRRGIARKNMKMPDEAIQDFERVIRLDKEMQVECRKLLQECKELKKQAKKKSKKLADGFIAGYAQQKPEPKLTPEIPTSILSKEEVTESWWGRSCRCLRETVGGWFSRR